MIEFDVCGNKERLIDLVDGGLYFGLIKVSYIVPSGNGNGNGWGFFGDIDCGLLSYAKGIGLND